MDLSRPLLLSPLLFALMFHTQLVTSAPLSWNETAPAGCYHMMQHYREGDQIITDEPCLNCTCTDSMLMCFLKVCPYVRPLNKGCVVRKEPGDCCPTVTCDHVPVPIMQMMGGGLGGGVPPLDHSTSTEATVTVLPEAITDGQPGCQVDGQYFPDGAQVPNDPAEPCDVCYCIRNQSACVQQKCTMLVPGCRPVFQSGVCCPVRYDCQSAGLVTSPPTTTSTTTSTTPEPEAIVTCNHNGSAYNDGDPVPVDDPCSRCYCMHGGLACVQHSCPSPLHDVHPNCTPVPPGPGQCCPQHYNCDSNGTLESSVGHTGMLGMITVDSLQGGSLEPASQITEDLEDSGLDSSEDKDDLEEIKATESATVTGSVGGISTGSLEEDDEEEHEAHNGDDEHDDDNDKDEHDNFSEDKDDDEQGSNGEMVSPVEVTSTDEVSSTERVTANTAFSATVSSTIASPTEQAVLSTTEQTSESHSQVQPLTSTERSSESSESSSSSSQIDLVTGVSLELTSTASTPTDAAITVQSTEGVSLTEKPESPTSFSASTENIGSDSNQAPSVTATNIIVGSTESPESSGVDFESGSGLVVDSGEPIESNEISGDGEDDLISSATEYPASQLVSEESDSTSDSSSHSTEMSGDFEEDQLQEVTDAGVLTSSDAAFMQPVPSTSTDGSASSAASEQSVVQEFSSASSTDSIEASGAAVDDIDTGTEASGDQILENVSELIDEIPLSNTDLSGGELDADSSIDSQSELVHSTEILPIEEPKPTATTTDVNTESSTEFSITSTPQERPTVSPEQVSSIASGSIEADIHSDGGSIELEQESSGDSGDSLEQQVLELVDEISGDISSDSDYLAAGEFSGDDSSNEQPETDLEIENTASVSSITQSQDTSPSSEAESTISVPSTTQIDTASTETTAESGTEGTEKTTISHEEHSESIENEPQPIQSSTVPAVTEIVDEVIDMAQAGKPAVIPEITTSGDSDNDGVNESSGEGEENDVVDIAEESSGESDSDSTDAVKPGKPTVTEISSIISPVPETADLISDGESELSGHETETDIQLFPDVEGSASSTENISESSSESNEMTESLPSASSTEVNIESSSQSSIATDVNIEVESDSFDGESSPVIGDVDGSGSSEFDGLQQIHSSSESSSNAPTVTDESGSGQTDSSEIEITPIEQMGGPIDSTGSIDIAEGGLATTDGDIFESSGEMENTADVDATELVENTSENQASTTELPESSSSSKPAEINGPSEIFEEENVTSEEESSGFVPAGTEVPEGDISEIPDAEVSTDEQIEGSATDVVDFSGDEAESDISSEGLFSSTIEPHDLESSGDSPDTGVDTDITEESSTIPSEQSVSKPSISVGTSSEDTLEGSGDENSLETGTDYISATNIPVTDTFPIDSSSSVDAGKDNGGVSTISNQTAQTIVDVLGAMLGSTESAVPVTEAIATDGGVSRPGADCSVAGSVFPNGSSVPSADRCQLECRCLDGAVMCQQVACGAAPTSPACRPVYSNHSCCPQYDCPNETASQCMMDGNVYNNGDIVQYPDPCSYCLCIDGEIICASQMCHPPPQLLGLNCQALKPEQAQCCSTRFHCDVAALEVLGFGKDNRTQGDVMFLGDETGEGISVFPSQLVIGGSEEEDKANSNQQSTSTASAPGTTADSSSAGTTDASLDLSTEAGPLDNAGETSTEITTITIPAEASTAQPEVTTTTTAALQNRTVTVVSTVTAVRSVLVQSLTGFMVETYTTVTVINETDKPNQINQTLVSKQSTIFKSRRPAATDDLANMPNQTLTVSTVVDEKIIDSDGKERRNTYRVNGVPGRLSHLVDSEGRLIMNQQSQNQYSPGDTIVRTTVTKIVMTIRPSDNMEDRWGMLYTTTVTTITNNVTDIHGKSTVTQQQAVSTAKRAASQSEAELFSTPQAPMVTTVVETTRVNSDGTLTTTVSRDEDITSPVVESQIAETAQGVTENIVDVESTATSETESQFASTLPQGSDSSTASDLGSVSSSAASELPLSTATGSTTQSIESSTTSEVKPETTTVSELGSSSSSTEQEFSTTVTELWSSSPSTEQESSTTSNTEQSISPVESTDTEELKPNASTVDLESLTSSEIEADTSTLALASSTEGVETSTAAELGSITEVGATSSSPSEESDLIATATAEGEPDHDSASTEEGHPSAQTDSELSPGTSRKQTTITTIEESLTEDVPQIVLRVTTSTVVTELTDSNGVIVSTSSETTIEEGPRRAVSAAERPLYVGGPRSSTSVVAVTTSVDESGQVYSETASGGEVPDRLKHLHPASHNFSLSDQIYLPGSRVETTTYTTKTEDLDQVNGVLVVHTLLNTTIVSVESSSDGRQSEQKRVILRKSHRGVRSDDKVEIERFSGGPVITTDVKVEVFEVNQEGVVTATINGVQQNDTEESGGSTEQSAMISVTNEVMEMLNEGVEQFANTTDISDAEVEGGAAAQTGVEEATDSAPATEHSAAETNSTAFSSTTTTAALSQHVFLGPGACLFDGRVYVSAQQIPRENPCDFCFCFRGDIICLQQSCPQPSPSCESNLSPDLSQHNGSCCVAQAIEGFCCPRYVCTKETPSLSVRTAPPHSLPDSYQDVQQYESAASTGQSLSGSLAGTGESSGCDIQGQHYQPGEIVEAASGPCLECRCGDDGMMACNPQRCQPQPILKKMMIAAAQRRKR